MVKITIAKPGREQEVVAFDHPTEVTVGRSAGCAVCLDFDPMVSRMHAVFMIDPPSVRLKDLNSTNGLTINGVAYGGFSGEKAFPTQDLYDGDEVQIGGTIFQIGVGETRDPRAKMAKGMSGNENSTVVDARPAKTRTGGVSSLSLFGGISETVSGMPSLRPEIPGYRVKGLLREGKSGSVYYGSSLDDGQIVSIKVVNTDVAFTKKMLDDFMQDIQELKLILHPNIVRLLEAGALGPQCLFLVMDYVNGEDLSSYLARCPKHRVPLQSAHGLMLQLGSAMCYAHSHGLAHRELRPRNIILFDDNSKVRAKIAEIGLAHCMEHAGIVTTEGMTPTLSNLGYMAPEQIADQRDSKPTIDVFALAAVGYEILTGRLPYDFPGEDMAENMAVVAGAKIVPIEERTPDLPEPLVVVMDRALSAEPEERYQNCCDLLEALENVRV